jgi:hypothetical protein
MPAVGEIGTGSGWLLSGDLLGTIEHISHLQYKTLHRHMNMPLFYLFIHLSIYPLIHLSIDPFIYLSIYLLIHLSIYLFNYLSIYPFIESNYPFIHVSMYPFIYYLFIYWFMFCQRKISMYCYYF